MKTRLMPALLTLLVAQPAAALSDASLGPAPPPVGTASACQTVEGAGPGATDAPTRLDFSLPIAAADVEGEAVQGWLRVEFAGTRPDEQLRGDQMGARLQGAAHWSDFGATFSLDDVDGCAQDGTGCEAPRAVLAYLGTFPPSDRHLIELVRHVGDPVALAEVCFFVSPEADPSPPPALDSESLAPDAEVGAEAEAEIDSLPEEGAEKAGCSATGGRGLPLWLGLVLLPLARRRRAR